jgi:rare lipoprotein A
MTRRAGYLFSFTLLLSILAAGCASMGRRAGKDQFVERGIASWYGPGFHGKRTANGERYDMHRLTAAHRSLPFGSIVEVRNLDNGKRVRVRINDRGPFVRGRIIDLSYTAAKRIGMIGNGTARVELRLIHRGGRAEPVPSSYVVQVGAYRDVSHAKQVQDRLVQSYDGVHIDSDGVWNRVLIGPFASRQDAEELTADLLAAGFVALVKVVQ